MSRSPDSKRAKFFQDLLGGTSRDVIFSGEIPDVEVPSFEGISLKLPAIDEVTEEILADHLKALQIEVSPSSPRAVGDQVGQNDEVTIDYVGYSNGQVLPFSTRADVVLGPDHDHLFPHLRPAIVGAAVGSTHVVEVKVPDDFPVEKFRGQPAFFSVRIKGASDLTLLDLESPEFLAAADMGDSLDEVLDNLGYSYLEEQATAGQSTAFVDAMVELADRAQLTVPTTLVDEEIGRRWAQFEGDLLIRINASMDHRHSALEAWLDSPELRTEVERRVKVTLMLRSIMAKEQSMLSVPDLRDLMDRLLIDAGLEPKEVREELQRNADQATNQRLMESLLYVHAAEYVFSKLSGHANEAAVGA